MRSLLLASMLLTCGALLSAQSIEQRAKLRGDGGPSGKCTVEVEVDGAAEVEIAGDSGFLRTLSERPAVWRRFECTAPMPRNPDGFRFDGVDGRGRQILVRDPRGNDGLAVVRIEDFKRGREGYTFDLEWRGAGTGYSTSLSPYESRYRASTDDVSACQDAVTDRLDRMGYGDVRFRSDQRQDSLGGRDDSLVGTVSARRGPDARTYSYSCSIDPSTGRVRDTRVFSRQWTRIALFGTTTPSGSDGIICCRSDKLQSAGQNLPVYVHRIGATWQIIPATRPIY